MFRRLPLGWKAVGELIGEEKPSKEMESCPVCGQLRSLDSVKVAEREWREAETDFYLVGGSLL